jgi:hypothetical protein
VPRRAGQQTVLDRLLDLLLVFSLRAWFGRDPAAAPAWFRALDDPQVGPALRALHADPRTRGPSTRSPRRSGSRGRRSRAGSRRRSAPRR